MERSPIRRFSMIRDFHLADLFTLMNGFAGSGAVLAFMDYLVTRRTQRFWLGVALLPLALAMDILDGRIARWRREASPLGQEMDSLADVVSFGVAPAAMGFAVGLQGGWDALGLVYFVGCGISRLARYNATAAQLSDAHGKVTHFEGFPIPSSLIIPAIFAVLAAVGRWGAALPFGTWSIGAALLHPLTLLYVAHGSAMISKTLRIPKP
jgi:CDP-diacylglycerol--serine O-phosphatidyltransferase